MRLIIFDDDTATVSGRVVGPCALELESRLVAALSDGSGDLSVDLREVEEIDADGLGALLDVHRRALRQGGELRIALPLGPARELFTATGTDRFFRLIGAGAPVVAAA